MILRLQEVNDSWDLLSSSDLQISNLKVRQLDELKINEKHLLFAVDAQGQRQLLIPIPPSYHPSEDTKSSGIHIKNRRWLDGKRLENFVAVICLKPHLNELFSIIITDVINSLASDPSRPDKTSMSVLNKWRELLEREPSEIPDLSRIVGLFGELWQLRNIVKHNPNAVIYWKGPDENQHDFSAPHLTMEVKTSLSRIGRFVTIHGHDQLEAPADSRLFLASVKLSKEENGENISEITASISGFNVDNDIFLPLLARAGFPLYVRQICDHIRFKVKENNIYLVDDSFPKIVSSSFENKKIPNGVIKLDYVIDLSSTPPFPLDEAAVEELYISLAG